jgi:hypothetical protein
MNCHNFFSFLEFLCVRRRAKYASRNRMVFSYNVRQVIENLSRQAAGIGYRLQHQRQYRATSPPPVEWPT